ncbi:MAG: hypothetical protein IT232_02740 [Flavobacteriales bacterium]|nr:hypothetical protein [Flavobacteriales bacterium]
MITRISKETNKSILILGYFAVFISLLLFVNKIDIVGYIISGCGVSLIITSKIIFIMRESFKILISKAFLWTLIPMLICFVLNKLAEYFLFSYMDTQAFVVYALSFIVALITFVRKIILNEQFFWY